jgi:dUTP pyrophosphatase
MSSKSILRFRKVSLFAMSPTKNTVFSAGFDLYSAEDKRIPPKGMGIVSTDLVIEVPKGCYGRLAPRSGLTVRSFIDIGAGVIDSDYRGVVQIVLFNFGDEEFNINIGDRIAQLICEKVAYPKLEEVSGFGATERGDRGFGSSDV